MKNKHNKLYAIIDIGAHSIRMLIGQVLRKSVVKEIEHFMVPMSIGRESFSSGVVSNRTINDLLSVLKKFKESISMYRIENITAVATSSIRDASNADVMIDRIFKATGIRIRVIEAIEETRILYCGIAHLMKERFGFLKDNVMIQMIGAGGTQIVFQSKGLILFTETFNVGTLRLSRKEDMPDRYYEFVVRPMTVNFLHSIKRFENVSPIQRFVVMNDDVEKLIREMDIVKPVNGIIRLTRSGFFNFAKRVRAMSDEDLSETFALNETLVKTTRVAFVMISTFFKLTEAKEILFPEISLSSAVLEIYASHHTLSQPYFITIENIVSAARALGVKYQYDARHAEKVTELSLSIFDQMRKEYTFTDEERVYLRIASILHDIGAFISAGSHHKHSARLISNAEILGLGDRDIRLISQIARYHRKANPKQTHLEYMSLPIEERVLVSRIASILRVADALDVIHTQQVEAVILTNKDEQCHLGIKMNPWDKIAFEILKIAMKKKADLFESFFGLEVRLERLE